MAITIETQPTNPIAANGYALFAISSTQYTQPQFQYVMDVYKGSDRVSRIRQYPNPTNNAIFDPSRIVSDYIEPNTDNWFTSQTQTAASDGSTEGFTFKFGEEYGVSPSSSAVLYDGRDVIGDPDVTGSVSTYECFLGSIPYNAKAVQDYDGTNSGTIYSFNWSDNYFRPTPMSQGGNDAQDGFQVFDWQTVSLADFGIRSMYSYGFTPNQARAQLYDANGDTLTFLALNGNFGDNFTYIPCGPINLLDAGASEDDLNNLSHYRLWVTDDSNYAFTFFKIDQDVCYSFNNSNNLDGLSTNPNLNFIFRNSYGFWDVFSTRKPLKVNSRISREITSQPFAPWSSADAAYPITNFNRITLGGDRVYSIDDQQEFTVNLGYLQSTDARMALDLIKSKQIYATYHNNEDMATYELATGYKPIIITNTSVEELTDRFRQKLFQIEITYRYAISNRSY